ncbi:MAG: replication-associated recombination protein A [Betaproteobacteria bacterium]|nr:MAG: replication-associated recombination protein A [Betaproteobacteria bacterium]
MPIVTLFQPIAAPPAPKLVSAAPLAERLRPTTIAQVVGQRHLLADGKPIANAIKAGVAHSMILWGPPGVGKTTLARLLADAFGAEMIALSAVLAGVKDIRDAIERAQAFRDQYQRRTIMFVDEVHRFNKSQQDAFLPHVESGLFTFIGATTENPSFEVNSALLSRAQVYVLESLDGEALRVMLSRALAALEASYTIDADAEQLIIDYADGDGRRFLNLLEQLDAAAKAGDVSVISADIVKNALTRARTRFDKGGEQFYDQISALHKSVRGSDPDAALYWFCRMLEGGADPLYVARRMIRMAAEDIGLADPRALEITMSAVAAFERLGSPEGELVLAEAVVFLAVAAKSNAVYSAYKAARAAAADSGTRPVPLRLRNAPTKLMKEIGYGTGYRYAHDEEGGFAAGESYFPDDMKAQHFYRPVDRGMEAKIKEKLDALREMNAKKR